MPGNIDFGINDEYGIALVDTKTGATKPLDEKAASLYERKIDLGDGSGVQVFKAATQDELIDKLTEAQVNETKKIKELSSARKKELKPDKREPLAEFKPQTLSDHDIADIASEIAVNPEKAFDRLFQAKVGATPGDIARQSLLLNQMYQERQEEQAVTSFMMDHREDYHPCPENLDAINKFFIAEDIPVTRNNMEYAYSALREDGKLKMPPVDPDDDIPQDPPQTDVVLKPPVTLSEKMSNRSSSPREIGSNEVAEIAALPIDKARERIVALMLAGRTN